MEDLRLRYPDNLFAFDPDNNNYFMCLEPECSHRVYHHRDSFVAHLVSWDHEVAKESRRLDIEHRRAHATTSATTNDKPKTKDKRRGKDNKKSAQGLRGEVGEKKKSGENGSSGQTIDLFDQNLTIDPRLLAEPFPKFGNKEAGEEK